MKNKWIIGIIIVLILVSIWGMYKLFFKNKTITYYTLSQVQKGAIVVSVSGSGQISTLDEADIKPKVSGEITKIYINKDQVVKKGDILFLLDPTEANRNFRNAEFGLNDAIFSLKNLEESKKEAQKNLEESYENAFNDISDIFNELPTIMSNLEKMFLESESSYKENNEGDIDYYRNLISSFNKQFSSSVSEEEKFSSLKNKYEQLRKEYLSIIKLSSFEKIEEMIQKTYNLEKEIAKLTREARDIITLYQETLEKYSLSSAISFDTTGSQLSYLTTVTSSLDQRVSNLFSLINQIKNNKDSINDYEHSIESQWQTIKQKEDAFFDAQEELSQHYIRAPFDGIIAKINVKKGDTVNTSTSLATLITNQKIAEISLNEIDVAKTKIDQKVNLSLDALPDITLTGRVIEIDTIGSVSQGVVNYKVKIILDNDDERIKPGMSVTAEIIVEVKTDILTLPNKFIKSQQGRYFVEVINIPENEKSNYLNKTSLTTLPTSPKIQEIDIGISNESLTEIVAGLNEGDIVVSSNSSTNTKTNQRTQTQFMIPGIIPGTRGR